MARMTGAKAFLVAIAAVTLSASSVLPAETGGAMRTGSVTSQPIGHYEFCQKNRRECGPGRRNVMPAKVTAAGWRTIGEVNASVNRAIRPVTDRELYGKDELWIYPVTAGDCEDFVLLKRRTLMQRGFSPADLLITVVRKPDGEGHAVLTVRTTDGDFILDNLDNRVRRWSETPYRYLKRQASFHAGRWVSIQNGDAMMVSAVGK